MNPGTSATFATIFCEKHSVAPDHFETILIERALNPRAQALHRLLQMMPQDFFASDFELARRIGNIRDAAELEAVVAEFHSNPPNRRALRRKIRVRVSLPRLRRIVDATFTTSLLSA